jgi:serine/threonine protein kinase
MIGTTVSHYRVLEKLGGGGMGVVYRAQDNRLHRQVAIKVLPAELTRDDDAKARFVLEAQAASALDHPNICTIYEIDETPDGQLFLVMAYYGGTTLKTRIDAGPLKVDEALDFAIQVAQGLAKPTPQASSIATSNRRTF